MVDEVVLLNSISRFGLKINQFAKLPKCTQEKLYLNKKVSITGKLVLYNDKPQIVVNEPKQIVLSK